MRLDVTVGCLSALFMPAFYAASRLLFVFNDAHFCEAAFQVYRAQRKKKSDCGQN